MYELLEHAIEAAQDAQQAILSMEATPNTKPILDASCNALRESIKQLSGRIGISQHVVAKMHWHLFVKSWQIHTHRPAKVCERVR